MALRRAPGQQSLTQSSARSTTAGPSSSGNLRYAPSWPLTSNPALDRQGRSENTRNVASPESVNHPDPTGSLAVASPSTSYHERKTSIQLMGIPRPEDDQPSDLLDPEDDQPILANINNRKRENSRLVFRDNRTGKLYQCDNFVEVDNTHLRDAPSRRQAQYQPGQEQQQGSPFVPVLQLENSDGTFTLLDEAASSTDTIITPFPSAPLDTDNSETSSHHEPRSRSPPTGHQASPANDQRTRPKIFHHSETKLVVMAALLIAALPSFAGSFATVVVFKATDRHVPRGIVGWFIFSNIILVAGIVMSLGVYADHRKARLAGMATEEWYEMEDQTRNARLASGEHRTENGRHSVDHHAIHEAYRRELQARDAQQHQQRFMAHAIEQASSRVAMPATSLSRPHIHTRLAERSASQGTLHPSAALGSQALPITPSTSNASILTTLCAGVTEPYSPLGNSRVQRNDNNPQEPEFRWGSRHGMA